MEDVNRRTQSNCGGKRRCERLNIVLRKGSITLLSVLLISSFVLFSGGKVVSANAVNLSSTHYNVAVSGTYPGQGNQTAITLSWSPKTAADLDYVDRISLTFTLPSSTTTVYRFFIHGTDSITFFVPDLANPATGNPNLTTNTSYNIYSDNTTLLNILSELYTQTSYIDDLESKLSQVNTYLANMYTSGIPSRQYDIPLECVPIYSYFSLHGGLAQYQASNMFLGQSVSFNDYLIYQGYNNPSDGNTGYLTAYAGEEYVFVFGLNTNTQMVQEGRMTLLYRDNQSTFNITKRTQKSHGQTLHISAFFGHSNEDYAANKNSAFTLNFTLNRFADYQYIPIYWGMVKYAPDYVWTLLQIDNPNEEEYLENANDLVNTTDELNTELNNIDTIQNDLTYDFEDNITAIDTSFDYNTNFGSKFLLSNGWLVEQFNHLTLGNPFGSALTFALIFGLALLLIGRVL